MNIKHILGGAFSLLLVATSCSDEMNYRENTTYDMEYIFQNFDRTVGFVTNLYGRLDTDFGSFGAGIYASACDEAEFSRRSGEVRDFYTGAWSPVNAKSAFWSDSYWSIRAANVYLQEEKGRTFSEYKFNKDYNSQMRRFKRLKFEARFLRAYYYFNLVRAYGDVPLTTTALTEAEVNTLKRTSSKEVFDFIVKECDAIVDSLPVSYSQLTDDAAANQTGRATSIAVKALKARALLYEASPLFNKEKDKNLYLQAAQAAQDVIRTCAANGLKLGKYSELWAEDNWQKPEMIFVRRWGDMNWFESYNFPTGIEGATGNANCPTQTLVDAYEMQATGKLWNEPGSGYDPQNPYDGRDPRFEMTIAHNGTEKWPTYNATPLETYYGGVNGEPLDGATPTGYYLKKYLNGTINLTSSNSNSKRHSWITYRLGEFYLNYAEALFKYTGSADAKPSGFDLSAREAVNVIRNREDVRMPALPEGLSQDEFWKKYENERMVELAFEGHRFWDLRRWREGDKLKSVTVMKITKSADGVLHYQRQTENRLWEDKMYLFPIPQSEMLKNPNLVQNTGW